MLSNPASLLQCSSKSFNDHLGKDVSLRKEKSETIPSELPNNDDTKGLSLPTSKQSNQDNLNDVAPKSDESIKQTDTPLHIIPSLTITEENKILPLEEYLSEDMMDRKMNNVLLHPGVKLKDKPTGILKRDSSSSESSYYSLSIMNKNLKVPNNIDGLMQAQSYRQLNTNKKGKSVAFSEKEHIGPSLKPEYIDFKPKYQLLNSNIKDGFDPFLRNLNKMSVGKRKDQDMCKYRDILSADIVELEDQDPPHPTCSKSTSLIKEIWPHGFDSATMKTVDTKEKLTHDPAIITIKTLSTKNKLKERLPNVSLPNFEGEPSLTENVNVHPCRLSKSLSFTSHIENLKQSMVLKSILSKNLQDLSDKLFSQTEGSVDIEARKKSHSSPLLSVHDKPLSSLEDNIFDKVQSLNNWFSKGDILNSESFISPVIKDISIDSLSESRSGISPEVERELVSKKYLETDEIPFSIKKKSSFKKNHLESEVSSSKLHDSVIKQIFTTPTFSKLKIGVEESRESQMNSQDQYPAAWESLSSDILVRNGENDGEIESPEGKSVMSQIIEAFPVDTLLESGIIKVIELNKEHQKSSLLHKETAFAEEKPKDSTEDYLEIESKTDSLSKQIIPTIPKETTSFFNRVEFIDNDQNISPETSKSQSTPDENTDLPSNSQRLDREENDKSSALENLSNLLMDKYNESDVIMLKSFLKNIFNVFFKYNQAERGQPEKERLIQHPFPNNTKVPEETKENFDKADKLGRKPTLSPKLRVFLEELSESEIENFKSELSKHIQHYLVERLSESGLVTREELTKIYQNLCLMNEEAEPKEQNVFLEKYSETVKETMSFVNNCNHHFIDKHLERNLRSFLNEILQNYFLKNLSESSFSKETESEPIHSNVSSLITESASISSQELGQSISRGSFGRRLEVNMKYPSNKFLQSYLTALSENELLNLKGDLSKYLQRLFTEKLSQSGQINEKQLEGISHHINLNISSSTPLKYIKPDLSFRDENPLMEEHSEKQNKYSEIVYNTTLPKVPEKSLVGTELTRKEEKEYFFLQNIEENPSIIREQKKYHLKEEAKTLTLIKVQTSSNKNTQAIPLKSSERLTDIVLKKVKKEHGFMQLPQAEHFDFKTEIQDPHNLSGKSKITQSNVCFERTLKMMPLEKKHNIYKLMVQEKPEVLSPYPRIPFCKMPNEGEEYLNKFTFSSRQNDSLTHFNSEAGENSKFGQYYQRLKGYNNNNKKNLITFSHYEKEIQALYIKPSEIYNEKCATVLASQLFKVVEAQKKSKPFLFPEVLKKEYLKPKVQKERNHVSKEKKSFNKIVKILPTAPPTTRILKKSVPRTLLHWTARRTVHDCLDKPEDLRGTSFQHLEKVKSRARLSGKSSDDSHYRLRHTARPYTAPEVSKRRESYSGKLTNPRMVSAGLVHLNVTIPDYEIKKMRPPQKLKC
ncbi:C2 calcium-dependent domain-containing protein 6 isoform X1 [Rousettus aegyptiacus]|uniref:C2 calcium-dependent domain-containing protein 6 isoform X1 n=1 Tax=Rousettus aegyptiacus TaxID=9407 RepID=UPI00168D5C6B|nr:C2 calcium-dependent domain-containing protein 6 isoform X1 [Rousettus aegyptiacus]